MVNPNPTYADILVEGEGAGAAGAEGGSSSGTGDVGNTQGTEGVWGDANYEDGGVPAWNADDPADPHELTGVGMVDDDGMLGGAGGDEPVQMPEEAHGEGVQHEEAHGERVQHEEAQAMEVEESHPEQQQQQQAVEAEAEVPPAPVSLLSAERRAELDGKLGEVEGRLATAEKGLADQEGQRNRAPNPALKKRFESSIAMFKKQVEELVAERDAIVAELAT